MKRGLLCVVGLTVIADMANAAEIPSELHGGWTTGRLRFCEDASREAGRPSLLLVSHRDLKERDTRCSVRDIQRTSETSWRMSFSCQGAGEAWEENESWSLQERRKINFAGRQVYQKALLIDGEAFTPCKM